MSRKPLNFGREKLDSMRGAQGARFGEPTCATSYINYNLSVAYSGTANSRGDTENIRSLTSKEQFSMLGWCGQAVKSESIASLFRISAVAAHHGPTPAFQTIKFDRACLGSILKGSRLSGDGQKA